MGLCLSMNSLILSLETEAYLLVMEPCLSAACSTPLDIEMQQKAGEEKLYLLLSMYQNVMRYRLIQP